MNNQTRRKSVRERLSKYTTKYGVADWVDTYMSANGRTPSNPMETGCRDKSISNSPRVSLLDT